MPLTLHGLRWHGAGYDIPAEMPGRLLSALLREGIAADPSQGFLSRTNEWAALRPWTLRGEAEIEAMTCERLFLCAQGVRGRGAVRVNGEQVAMFGDGDFFVEITGPAMGNRSVTVELAFAAGSPEGSPPMPRIGVDGALSLRGVSQLVVDDFRVIPRLIDGYGVLEARPGVTPYVPGRYVFRYAVAMGVETLATEEFTEKLYAAHTVLNHRVVVPVPRRWRLGAENEPVIVRLTVLRAGLVCDDRLLETGFRDASFAESPRMQLFVEDERIFFTGIEWGGGDAPAPPDRARARLGQLRRAHGNCLRVYGLQADAFYDLLDREGFLLWQVLPHDPEAAAGIVRSVRHRPSLIAYGMESLYAAFNRPADSAHPTVRAIEQLVDALDGMHPFFGPIPGGPIAQPDREVLGTGVSIDVLGPTQYPGPECLAVGMNRDDALVRTVACPAPPLDMKGLAGGVPYWPPDTALWEHRAAVPLNLLMLREWFDAYLESPEPAVRLARALQAETVRYALERARMRAANASGVFLRGAYDGLPSLNSPALFDGETPRPAYWAMESALRPVHACARLDGMGFFCGTRFTAQLCLLVDGAVMGPLTVRARLYLPDGTVLAESACDAVPKTGALDFIEAQLPDYPCALVLRVTAERFGEVLDVNDYTVCVTLHALLWPMANAPFASVRVRGGEIVNECGQIALGVACGGFRDGRFPGWGALLPGEKRAIRQENPIEGLNLEPIE